MCAGAEVPAVAASGIDDVRERHPDPLTVAHDSGYVREVVIDRGDRELLQEMLDKLPMFVNVVEGPEFEIIAVNQAVRDSPVGSTLGKRFSDFYPGASPLREALERVYATGVAETIHEHPTYFPDGSFAGQYYTRSFVPLGPGPGGAKRIMVVVQEVTDAAKARAENRAELQRLFEVLEEAPTLMTVYEGPELRLAMMNRRARELFCSHIALGGSFAEIVAPDNPTLVAARRVFETGVAETHQMMAHHEAFAGRSFTITFVPLRGADGKVARILMASVETTELFRAMQAKDQFLAMLGHELRNPLAPISVAIQVMRLDGADSPALDVLERQVKHLTRLVDDLLDSSRITRGLVAVERTELDVSTVIHRALELSSPLLEQRGHRVVTEIEHRGLDVSGDADRLAQVLTNLITNAAKYSEPGAPIRIAARRAGDRVTVSVSDRGIGIAPDMLEKVFEVFVQQPQTLDRSHGGLGLGLAIAKSLVEAHGGVVFARSDGPGLGSTFVVELPAIDIRSAAPANLPAPPRFRLSRSPARILLVDDNRDAVDVLRIALEGCGHTIAFAYDGPSALEVAATHEPQLALVDIGLPVMDGYQLAELLRERHAIPVVAVTGYGLEADRERAVAAGFAAHLIKPVDFGELAALVDRLCANPSP